MSLKSPLIFSTSRRDGLIELGVGGFADRLKGVYFCVVFSLLLGRKLQIAWQRPECFNRNFEGLETIFIKEEPSVSRRFDLIDRPLDRAQLMGLLDTLDAVTEPIVLYVNWMSCSLFKELASEWRSSRQIDIPKFSVVFDRYLSYLHSDKHRAFFNSTFKLRASAPRFVIGCQVRMGGDGRWNDPMMDNLENLSFFFEAVDQLVSERRLVRPSIFVTSDSSLALQELVEGFQSRGWACLYFNDKPAHLERSEPFFRDFGQVYRDFFILSLCDLIISGAGDFSRMASLSANKQIEFVRYWEVLGLRRQPTSDGNRRVAFFVRLALYLLPAVIKRRVRRLGSMFRVGTKK